MQASIVPRASNPVVGVLVGADREAFAAYVAARSAPLLRTAFLPGGAGPPGTTSYTGTVSVSTGAGPSREVHVDTRSTTVGG